MSSANSNTVEAPLLREAEINRILEENDVTVLFVARNKLPGNEELQQFAQNIRLKFWKSLQQTEINNTLAYINRIGFTERVDTMRRYKPVYALPVNEDGELYAGRPLFACDEEALDPAIQYERREQAIMRLEQTVDAALTLPDRQQYLILCTVKEQCADTLPVAEIFAKKGLDIEAINWPEDKADVIRLKASFPIVRKKLHFLKRIFNNS